MSLPRMQQSALAFLDYSFNWGDGTPTGLTSPETISASLWTITNEAGPSTPVPVLSASGIDVTGKITQVWVTGGLENSVWRLENKITTTAARVDSRAFELTIKTT